MCGIVFSINTSTYTRGLDDWFTNAMLASQVRGTHSTGMFQVEADGRLDYYKAAMCASTFVKEKQADVLLSCAPSSALTVGHVRHATSGGVVSENAHPFLAARKDGSYVTMVHNGTIASWRNKEGADLYSVDSEWVANVIAEKGTDAFKYIDGAYALVWYDSATPDVVYMARNKERPLHYTVVNSGQTIVGCSELGMLGWLNSKHGFEIDENSSYDTPYFLEDGYLYEFSLTEVGTFKKTLLPSYDASLGNAAVKYYPISNSYKHIPKSRYSGYSGFMDDEDGEDEYYNNLMGYSGYDRYYSSSYDQEDIIEGVKAALKKARNSEEGDATTEPVEAVATIVEADDGYVPSLLDRGGITLKTVDASQVSEAERQSAKSMDVYGMVVLFCGLMYDEKTQTMLGQFTLYENGTWNDYDAELRNVDKKTAAKFMDTDGELAAVVGVVGTNDYNALSVVVPLTPQQETFVVQTDEADYFDDERVAAAS